MSLQFEPLRINEITKETNDCVSISFQIPTILKEKFSYQQGQYITIKTSINGEEIRRSYSLCSSPLETDFRVAIKKIKGGIFSTYANETLQVGDVLDVMPPIGKFHTALYPSNKKNYVFIAAGSGITPILSIIKTTLQTEAESNITLMYGNSSRHSIIFKEQLEALKNKYFNRFRLIHILSRERTDTAINFGRIDTIKCELLFDKLVSLQADEFFICGPEELSFCVKDFLKNKGVEDKKIHFELFASANKVTRFNDYESTEMDEKKSKILISIDGRSFGFDLAFKGSSILDAAIQKGADLPYACKGGVCCTCKAKLVSGNVTMDVNYGLEPDEIAQGFILTCQSHPTTENVAIDFDIK